MRAAEFIFEALLHDTVKDIAIWISPHVDQQRQKPERNVSWAEINKILKRIKIVRPKLYDMVQFNQFYLRDNDTNVELGCVMVDLHGTQDETPTVKYLLKINTVIRSASPHARTSPVVAVNAVIKEDQSTDFDQDQDFEIQKELSNAVDNWMDMWDSESAAKVILANPKSAPFKSVPSGINYIYRAIVLNDMELNAIHATGPVIAYATNINGCYEFLQSIEIVDEPWVIVRKKFNPADFLLDFTALYEHLNNPTEYSRYISEHEVWMKPTTYYKKYNAREIVERSEE